MRVELDRSRCTGHGRCYTLGAGVFDSDDDGYGVVVAAEVPEELRERAVSGAMNCPEDAITIIE